MAEELSAFSRSWGIGLTGGIASGKSTIAQKLREHGYLVIDADQVSRLVVMPGTPGLKEVVKTFGEDILDERGELNRAKLREIVFQDADKRRALENIIHHRLGEATLRILSESQHLNRPKIWFYEASLIYERSRQKDFREVWVAYCPREVQIQRVMARDKMDEASALRMLDAQMDPLLKVKQADRVIDTHCDADELERRVIQTLEAMKEVKGEP